VNAGMAAVSLKPEARAEGDVGDVRNGARIPSPHGSGFPAAVLRHPWAAHERGGIAPHAAAVLAWQ